MHGEGLTTTSDICANFTRGIKSDSHAQLMMCTLSCIECVQTCDLNYLQNVLVPAVKSLVTHSSADVSESMLVNLPDFIQEVHDVFKHDCCNLLVTEFLPLIYKIIYDSATVIGEIGSETLASMLVLLPDRMFRSELPHLKQLLDAEEKEIRIIAAQVLSFVADYFDPDTWYEQLYEMISALSSDLLGSVRSRVPALIANYVSKVKNPKNQAELSSRYVLFAHDAATYVRKSAAESLVTLSQALDDNSRKLTVIPVIRALIADPVRTVSSVALKSLGPLIYTLGDETSEDIVGKFTETLRSTDSSLAYSAAHSFPAVALALGKKRWDELSLAFLGSVTSREFKTRKALAHGLVAFGYMINPDELLSVVRSFARDVPAIAVGVISNLFQLLNMVSDKDGLKFCLENPTEKYSDWRIRLHVSQQLRYCMEDYDRAFLFNISKELVLDTCAAVRKDAAISFAILMVEDDISVLESMANSDYYVDRLSAAHVCMNVPSEKSLMCLGVVKKLVNDPVPNVRIRVAEAVSDMIDNIRGNSELDEIFDSLQDDVDMDVQNALFGYNRE